MSLLFRGSKHVEMYAKFRPVPPDSLINRIVNFVKENIPEPLTVAVDIGCGSGQSTRPLSKHFERVIGTDVSESQISQAKDRNKDQLNVTYNISPAESIPLSDKSVQLITVGQACHWFDMSKFYPETKRVLAPNGVLALYGYDILRTEFGDKSEALDSLIEHFFHVDIGKYWETGRELVDTRYESRPIHPPFAQVVRDESHSLVRQMSVRELTGFFTSASAFQALCKDQGDHSGMILLEEFEKKFLSAAGTDKTAENLVVKMYHPFFLLLARD